MSGKRITIFWIIFFLLAGAFFAINYLSPQWVGNYYSEGNFSFLNKIAVSQGEKPLGFYQGRFEEELYGPIAMTIAGILITAFSLIFLKEASMRKFILAVFLFLLVTRFEVLIYPPYGDAIGGPFAEAIWLKNHSFNFLELSKQPIYVAGGPKVYLFSIYPTFLALMMKVLPWPKAFLVVNHLLVFVLAAGSVAVFREILSKVFDRTSALLGSILFLSFPLFQAQSEAINMEIPNVFFSVLAIYYLINRKFGFACLMSIIAAMIKGVAVLVCAVVFVFSIFMFFMDEKVKRKKRALIWGFTAIGFAALKMYLSVVVMHEGDEVDMVGAFAGWPSIKNMEVLYAFIASSFIFALYVLYDLFIKLKGQGSKLRILWDKYHIPLIMFTTVVAWVGLFLNSYAVSPRYRLLLAPFSTFSIIYAFTLMIKWKKVTQVALIGSIIFSFYCSFGYLWGTGYGNYVLLERSLEYRNDINLYRGVVKEIEENYSGFTVGAPFLVAQMFGLPELGYVSKKFDVVIYGMQCTYGGIKNFNGLKELDVNQTVWIGLQSDLPESFEYPVSSQDRILKKSWSGDKFATIFMGGIAIEKVRLMMIYLNQRGKINKIHP